MKVGDLVKMVNPFVGEVQEHHGIVLKISQSMGDLAGHVIVQWVGIYGDRLKAHPPRDLRVVNESR